MTALDTARCALTDLPAGQCACKRCRPDLVRVDPLQVLDPFDAPADAETDPRWFRANFPGRCADCGEPFEAGAQIRPSGRGYIAECCEEPS